MADQSSSKKRILFLDIDSTLNYSAYGQDIYDDDGLSSKFIVEPNVPLCIDCIAALRYIVDNVKDLAIVWSTDWRLYDKEFYDSWKNPRLYLEAQDWFNKYLIDKTPKRMSSTRFEEIMFWLRGNESTKKRALSENCHEQLQYYDIANYVILDDYYSYAMDNFKEHFFLSEWESGLTMDQAKKLVEFINTDCYDTKQLDWRNWR